MEGNFEQRLVDDAEHRRLKTVLYAGIWSLVILTGLVTLTHHTIEPQHGWIPSLGVGALVGFWVSILMAGVAGNGIYEIRHERHVG